MKNIAPNIYYEDSYAGVILGAVTRPRGTLLIDAPLRGEDARAWKSALLTQSPGTYRLLVILDIHTDRTLGSRAIDYPIIAHQKTADGFDNRTAIFKGQNAETGSEWEYYPEVNGTRWERPSIMFENTLVLHWGGTEIRIEHHPGPTPGATWVHIPEEKILFVGDAVVKNQPPFLSQADLSSWFETLNLLTSRKFSDYTIISGRSGPVTIDEVREFRSFLKSLRGRLDTLAKREGAPEETEKFIPALLEKLSFSPEMEEFYTNRLKYGLHQYYLQNYQNPDRR